MALLRACSTCPDYGAVAYDARHPLHGPAVKGQWTVSRNREDTLDVCVTTLQHYGVDPDRNCIAAHMAAFRDASGAYVERTDYTIEMLLWQNS